MSSDSRHAVATADAVSPGERLLVEVEGIEIAVFNVEGEYYAYLNWCAHQGGPVCEGSLTGRADATYDRETLETRVEWVDEGETLLCPWHDWEYDVRSGRCVSRPDVRLPSYPVTVEDAEIVIDLAGGT